MCFNNDISFSYFSPPSLPPLSSHLPLSPLLSVPLLSPLPLLFISLFLPFFLPLQEVITTLNNEYKLSQGTVADLKSSVEDVSSIFRT